MQAYKLKGKVDRNGKLIITEPMDLTPGEVEVIVLQSDRVIENNQTQTKSSNNRPSKVKAFQDWFTQTELTPSDLDADEAKWVHLKEKHNL